MSIVKTLSEYLDVAKRGFQNRDKIIESMAVATQIKNGQVGDNRSITPEIVAEIMRRKDLCKECPFNSENAKKRNTYNSSIPFEHCILCKCRIGGEDTKEYCLSCTCGAEVWNKEHPDYDPLIVRWGAIEK